MLERKVSQRQNQYKTDESNHLQMINFLKAMLLFSDISITLPWPVNNLDMHVFGNNEIEASCWTSFRDPAHMIAYEIIRLSNFTQVWWA